MIDSVDQFEQTEILNPIQNPIIYNNFMKKLYYRIN